jgi:hypothetical protein
MKTVGGHRRGLSGVKEHVVTSILDASLRDSQVHVSGGSFELVAFMSVCPGSLIQYNAFHTLPLIYNVKHLAVASVQNQSHCLCIF